MPRKTFVHSKNFGNQEERLHSPNYPLTMIYKPEITSISGRTLSLHCIIIIILSL